MRYCDKDLYSLLYFTYLTDGLFYFIFNLSITSAPTPAENLPFSLCSHNALNPSTPTQFFTYAVCLIILLLPSAYGVNLIYTTFSSDKLLRCDIVL